MIIPSIDLIDGKAVQLRQGKQQVLSRDDVYGLFDEFSLYGEVALIDLDAAMGKGSNRFLIEELLKRAPARVGGGIRELETARAYLKAGASKIIIGTAAREPWVRKLPREALIFAIDAKGDNWLQKGWSADSGLKVEDLIDEMAGDCSEFLYTQVEKEGLLEGLDRVRIKRIIAASPLPVTVAGGVTDEQDLRFLNQLGANAQIGMALYTGKLSLTQAFFAGLDFEKQALIPTIVQDADSGDVLMLAYSSQTSLRAALQERRGIYWSRSRNELWRKGDSSGHLQRLLRVDYDCDGDTLLFRVRQSGQACHFNRWSCFAGTQPKFRLADLDQRLAERAANMPAGSYSAQLFADPALRAEKLREETEELIEAQSFEHARWEAADLLYFTLVNARAKGVGLQEILSELRSRHGNS